MCLQEVEIEKDYDFHALNLNNYCLEIENNSVKSRVGIFISNNVNYTRMHQLEGINSHIIIIDTTDSCTVKRIIKLQFRNMAFTLFESNFETKPP